MPFIVVLAIVLAAAVVVSVGGRSLVRRIQAAPDQYTVEQLSRELTGEEVMIPREDGTQIRAVSAGDGPTIIFAHGYGYSALEWNVIWDKLVAAGYRLIAFDQRGHGRSTIGSDGIGSKQMAADYQAVLEHLDAHDAVLVAHSMGTFLSIVFLLTYHDVARERLKGAVLIAPFAGNIFKGSLQNRMQVPMIQYGIMDQMLKSETLGTLLFGSTLFGDHISPSALKVFLKGFAAQRHRQLVPILKAFGAEDYYARLGEIKLPIVLICGKKDRTTPAWHAERLGRDISGARNIWLDGKGHLLNWEAPDQLVDAIQSI